MEQQTVVIGQQVGRLQKCQNKTEKILKPSLNLKSGSVFVMYLILRIKKLF